MATATRRATERLAALVAAALGVAAPDAHALVVSPRLDVSETWSDNPALAPDGLARSDWVTDLAPGLRAEHRGAHSSLFLDAHWHKLVHRDLAQLDTTQRFVQALGAVELVERRLALDALASINRASRSPFGAASTPDAPSTGRNSVETRALQVSPHAYGPISDRAVYDARVSFAEISADDPAYHDTRATSWTVRATNATRASRLGWAADTTGLVASNSLIGQREDARVRASGIVEVYPDVRVTFSEGYEWSDFASATREGQDTPGAGVEWSPGPRTTMAAVAERRFFGTGHLARIQHRTAFTAWRLESSRDATFLPAQVAASRGVGTLQGLFDDLLAASIPDPGARADAARRRMQDVGLPPVSPLGTSYLETSPALVDSRQAAVAYVTPRDSVSIEYTLRDKRSLPGAVSVGLPVDEDVRQRRWSLGLAHALTPQSRLVLAAARLATDGTVNAAPEHTRQSLVTATFKTRLGRHVDASLAFRHDRFDGGTAPSYRENAVVATVTVRL